MNDAEDWAGLRDAWTAAGKDAALDVKPMIARARRQRHLILWTIGAEWALSVLGGAVMIAHWPRVQQDGLLMLWWVFFCLATCIVLAVATWTRLAGLREPAGTSLRDWLGLRRRRALLGLRLARVTRWTSIAMLPAPLVVLATARPGWTTLAAFLGVSGILAGGWIWARYRTARLAAEVAEVDALALEWLDEPLVSGARGSASRAVGN